MKKLLKKIRDLNFAAKLMGAYMLSLTLILTLITYNQIDRAVLLLQEDSQQNLDLITSQVALNFSDFQDSLTTNIYSRLKAFSVPELMGNHIPGNSDSTVKNALEQMITGSTSYDFVMLELLDGSCINTSARQDLDYHATLEACTQLLRSTTNESSGGSWYRMDDGNVFIVREIYDTSPLRRVGRGVFHLRNNLFKVSDSYTKTGFLFFDRAEGYLTCAGMEVDEATRERIISAALEKKTAKNDFFISTSVSGSWTTVGYSSMESYRQMRSRTISLGISYGLFGLVSGSILMMLIIRTTTRKLRELQASMEEVANGDLAQRVTVTDNDDISQMSATFNHMTVRISELLEELVEKERLKSEAEFQIMEHKYRALETQIRPHFIYNALELINSMAKIKGETEIVEIVQRMSRYFRNITINTTKQFITTQQEFDALEDYTEIYRLIHGDKLHTSFRARENARNAMIPTMIVQPVVENSLKHGLRGQGEDSELIVHAYVRDDKLNLTVKDNGYGFTEEQLRTLGEGGVIPPASRSGIGLANVTERLKLLYNGEASIQIANREKEGVIVKIIIPLSYSEPESFEDDDWDDTD